MARRKNEKSKKANERETESDVKWEANYLFMITFETTKSEQLFGQLHTEIHVCAFVCMCVTHYMIFIAWDSLYFLLSVHITCVVLFRFMYALLLRRKGSMSILCIEESQSCYAIDIIFYINVRSFSSRTWIILNWFVDFCSIKRCKMRCAYQNRYTHTLFVVSSLENFMCNKFKRD